MDVQNAKEYFKKMGCSLFLMAREDTEKYYAYLNLGISRETEIMWTKEEFDEIFEKIKEGMFPDSGLRWRYCYLCKLVLKIDTKESFRKLLELTEYISYRLPQNEWVVISECIDGSIDINLKKGPVFQAFRTCGADMAREYLRYSKMFCRYIEGAGMDYDRCIESQKRCSVIETMLRLWETA